MPARKYNKEKLTELLASFEEYIRVHPDPDIAGFLSEDKVATKYWLREQDLQEYKEFRPLLERAYKKSEHFLLGAARDGAYNTIMGIFRLKQPHHGYRDRFEQDIRSDGQPITFVNAVPRPNVKKPGTKKPIKPVIG